MKALVSALVAGFIFFTGTAQAYDLPKIRVEKKAAEKIFPQGSDWANAEEFEQEMKWLLDEKGTIPASSKRRINRDKNLVFVGFYKGNAYFLDRYSIDVAKNTAEVKSWRQHIFPISSTLSAHNTKATKQKFCVEGRALYNALRRSNNLAEVPDDEDRKFLLECIKVGYYYAFKKELDVELEN